jgi:hypothetical protein
VADEAARQAVAAALGIPANLKEPVLRYLALFRPDKHALSWSRAGKLLDELAGMIASGTITRDGRVYSAPVDVWAKALDQLQAKQAGDKPLTRPLKNHGYLLEIVRGMADKAEARQEQVREDRRRQQPEGKRSGMAEISAQLQGLGNTLRGRRGKAES